MRAAKEENKRALELIRAVYEARLRRAEYAAGNHDFGSLCATLQSETQRRAYGILN
jgi:hypothetical protein